MAATDVDKQRELHNSLLELLQVFFAHMYKCTYTHTKKKNLLTYYLCHVTDHFIGCGVLTVRELDLRSMVQILLKAMLRNSLGQVAHSYVPLSPSSITWYRPKGSDAVRLGR